MNAKAKKRRTNAERSAETRGKLLDAAEWCLIDLGYSKTTNSEVCSRAGVSNGALLHHFHTRENLLTSALERLYGRLKEEVIGELEGITPGADRVDTLVDVLWSVFDRDEFKVVLELWLAAANDEALRLRVFPVMEEFSESLEPTAARLLPDMAEDASRFGEVVALLFGALQGMGLGHATFGRDEIGPDIRGLLKEMFYFALEKD